MNIHVIAFLVIFTFPVDQSYFFIYKHLAVICQLGWIILAAIGDFLLFSPSCKEINSTQTCFPGCLHPYGDGTRSSPKILYLDIRRKGLLLPSWKQASSTFQVDHILVTECWARANTSWRTISMLRNWRNHQTGKIWELKTFS